MSGTAATAIGDAELHRRQQRSQRAFHRTLAQRTPDGVVLERPGGVQATIVPTAPRLALLNSVLYEDRESLLEALGELRDAYGRAGVEAWAVWVPPWDRPAARMLRDAGHSRGGALMVTAAALADLDLEPEDEIELEPHPTAEMVAWCNDQAHAVAPEQSMVAALAALEGTETRAYAVRRRGRLACAGLVRCDAGNCYPWGLAATEAARGSMAAIELMRLILRDALAAGCETGTGEVTRAGETIGAYLGKRPIGRYDVWVGRAAPA
jgi:hypothetical protein